MTVKPAYFLVQMLLRTDSMNVIVSFEDLFDVSVLLQSTFKIMSPFTEASRPRDFVIHVTAGQITSKLCLLCFSSVFKQILDGLYLSFFRYTAAVDFNWQFLLLNISY